LFVCFAAGLELAKPLSVAAALSAFRSLSLVRGVAFAVLALVAVVYSLTAELSLMAASRSDTVAQREAVLKAAADAESTARRAAERYERAKTELAALPAARPVGELQAEIDALLLRPGANGCVAVDGRVTREVCPKVADLRTEKARAERRAELEQLLAAPLPTADASQPAVGKPDPAASALAAYLALLGIVVAPAVLSEWFVLVPVLALEVGSAFSVLLVQSVAPAPGVAATRQVVQVAANRKEPVVQPAAQKPAVQVVRPANLAVSKEVDHVREKVKVAIVDQLKASGGFVSGGERGLAKLVGANRSTMRRAINGLVMAGVVVAEATRNGTLLRLAA
jgi:hypothetical protein